MRKVIAEISARHVHLSQVDMDKLFGRNYKFKRLKDLSQPGEFATQETLLLKGPKDSLRVRIVAPARKRTQIELAASDCYKLGTKPVLRVSGNHQGTNTSVYLQGPRAKLHITKGVIVPWRHLHISASQAKAWGLKAGQKIKATIKGDRAVVLNNIVVRTGPFKANVHLDTDEANAAGLTSMTKIDLDI